MAERRMFAKTIIDSDAFLDMPISARLLYYDLSMRADDDGFVNSPKKIMRMVGATQDDISILAMRKFIIPFESGVVVIKHWKIHNYIRKDTYNETKYKKEKATLAFDENNAYTQNTFIAPDCQLPVDGPSTQVRLGKDRLGKESIEIGDKPQSAKRFTPPSLEDVKEYCKEKGLSIDPERFVDFYTSKGWMVGKNKMKDWKSAARGWEARDRKGGNGNAENIGENDGPSYDPERKYGIYL